MDRMEGQMDRMEGRMDRMEGRMDRMEGQMTQMQGQLEDLQTGQAVLSSRLDKVEDDVLRVKACLELDVEKRFDGVNEGITAIQERLEELKGIGERTDKLENDVIVLKTVVKLHSENISELKRA